MTVQKEKIEIVDPVFPGEATKQKPARFRVEGYKSIWNGEFFFRVRSRNNQIVMTSEGYREKRSVTRLFASLQEEGLFRGVNIKWIEE